MIIPFLCRFQHLYRILCFNSARSWWFLICKCQICPGLRAAWHSPRVTCHHNDRDVMKTHGHINSSKAIHFKRFLGILFYRRKKDSYLTVDMICRPRILKWMSKICPRAIMTRLPLWSRSSPVVITSVNLKGMKNRWKHWIMQSTELNFDLSFQAAQKPSWNSIANLAKIRRRWCQQREKCTDHEGEVRTTKENPIWWGSPEHPDTTWHRDRWRSPEHRDLAPGDHHEVRHTPDHDHSHCKTF